MIRRYLTGFQALALCLTGCASSNTAQVQHETKPQCQAEFDTDAQGKRTVHLIRNPDDSGFIQGAFAADIKIWVTATGIGTKLVTLHAAPEDDVIPIPVERIRALALQSCVGVPNAQGTT